MAAPHISEEEVSAFHASHFSATSTHHFTSEFLGTEEDQHAHGENCYGESYGSEDDDGLGYYADGVKRTLTDEQIAIFRHSEIQALLRERRHAKEAKEDEEALENVEETILTPLDNPEQTVSVPIEEPLRAIIGPIMEGNLEDGELEDGTTETSTPPATGDVKPGQKKSNKKKKSMKAQQKDPKSKGFFRQNVKPDLRKRTWDVVDKGVDGLEYDEIEEGAAARPSMGKRRQISYDD